MKYMNKMQIKIVSLNKQTLNIYKKFLIVLFRKLNIHYSFSGLPKKKKKLTLLKSPHVNKKAREQFQMITYSLIVSLNANIFVLKFLKLNQPKLAKIYIKYFSP